MIAAVEYESVVGFLQVKDVKNEIVRQAGTAGRTLKEGAGSAYRKARSSMVRLANFFGF